MSDLAPQILTSTDPAAVRDFAIRLEELPPRDAAQLLSEQAPLEAARLAEYLDPETAGKILVEMSAEVAAIVISVMEPPEAAVVLEHIDPDDRVDILQAVQQKLRDELVGEMNPERAAETRDLSRYGSDTAGGIMTTQVTALFEFITVDDAIQTLRQLSQELEQMFYVYVINSRRQLVGVLSMRDLILALPSTSLHKLMIRNVRSVRASMDQEAVANLMRTNGYLAMPVVDDNNVLLGMITVDDVVQVMQDEATEDVQKMFGAGAEERLSSPWHFSFKKRVVWLEVNLATAFLAAWVVSAFTDTIAALPILAAYQTIVSGMGGNGGAQAMAVSIRGIAVGEAKGNIVRHVLKREFMVGLTSGVVVGITTGVIASIFNYSHSGVKIGLVVCIALIFNHINACTTGVIIPFVMKRCGFDPAQSATIFATTFTDCGGFFACLGLAKLALMMHWIQL